MNKKYLIYGASGFGREALASLIDSKGIPVSNIQNEVLFMDIDSVAKTNDTINGCDIISESEFDSSKYKVFVAIGDPEIRKSVIAKLPSDTEYFSIIHPTAVISKWVTIGKGSIVTAGTIITTNIIIGNHAHLNLNTTIGHDCVIGDFFTTAPGVHISGICNFGECVYFGTNSSVRQSINICDNVTIGMGAIVVKNITEPGIYIGSPAKKFK